MKDMIRKFLYFLLVRVLKINPDSILYFAFYTNNIRPGHDLRKNGELYLVEKVKRFFSGKKKMVVFDVGANEGSYSRLLSEHLPGAEIYAFEPNFELVKESKYASAKIFPIGLGEKQSNANLFINQNSLEEASIYKDVAKYLAGDKEDYAEKVLDIEIDQLDHFCDEHGIQEIDFLKIDTEGNEYAVLMGAKRMLAENRIKVIQFEFNEMNVISRVFLKDYYDLLSENFKIFRLHKTDLFPLEKYHAHNEIFVWQNLVAVNKQIANDFV